MISWIRNKIANRKREFPLIHVHTFETGERIYTYEQKHWGKLSSRYYRGVNEAYSNLETFAARPHEWKAFMKDGKELCQKGVNSRGEEKDKIFMDLYSAFGWWEAKARTKTPQETMLELQYCLFFCLDGEKETGYSELYNDKKIELLNNAPPDTRDFFFQMLKENIADSLPTSGDGILSLLMRLKRVQWELEENQKLFSNTQKSGTD